MSRITNALNKLLTGKGFYLALALCLVGSALAAFLGTGRFGARIEEENRQIAEELGAPLGDTGSINLPLALAEEPSVPIEAPSTPDEPASEPGPVAAKPQPGQSAFRASAPAVAAAARPAWFWPVAGALIGEYSGDELVKNLTLDQWQTHNGVDIQAPAGAKVLAAADGTVRSIDVDPLWGTVVELEHSGGLTSVYRGLAEPVTVSVGAKVKGNTALGALGEIPCECLLNSHLHFELLQGGKRIDPAVVLP